VRRVLVGSALLIILALLAGCGGAGMDPVPTSNPEPPPPATGENAVTVSALEEPGSERPTDPSQVTFPAETPEDILVLAAQHPDGRVVYATELDGAEGFLSVTRGAGSGVVAYAQDGRTTRVGVDLENATIRWTCIETSGAAPDCADGDIDQRGAIALATAALLVGEDRVRQLVSRLTGNTSAQLGDESRAGVDASCLTGAVEDIGRLAVCVSPSGFVTDAVEGSTSAIAVEVRNTIDTADLARPSGIAPSAGVTTDAWDEPVTTDAWSTTTDAWAETTE
jgi:hypothetical protein